jgi:hypothetical protein
MARMKSLKVDQADLNKLRNGRFPNMGTCVSSEFYQTNPFFFTRECSQLNIIGQYRGASAFLIAGGPSFKDVDKEILKNAGVWSMTLNNSICSFRGNAACIVDDPSRFVASLWLDHKVTKYVPAALFEKPLWDNRTIVDIDGNIVERRWQPMDMNVGDCPNVIGYRRNEKLHAARFLYEDTINWGNHKQWGGGRSVMLASLRILFLLGFRKVFLVGVDFDMRDDRRYHFDEGRTESAVKGNSSTYAKMTEWFEKLRPHFDAENFTVKNCNPDSNLKAFDFISVKDAVYEATSHIGDVFQERSDGMYTKWEDKMAAWQASQNRGPQMVVEKPSNLDPSQIVVPNPPNPPASPNPFVQISPPPTAETPSETPNEEKIQEVVKEAVKEPPQAEPNVSPAILAHIERERKRQAALRAESAAE